MTQPPSGPPPGGAGYPPDPRYPGPEYPFQDPRQAAPSPVDPQYLPPPYPPGQEPLPPRRRQPRGSPVIAPVLAFVGLLLVAGASIWGISVIGVSFGDSSAAAPSATPIEAVVAGATDAPDELAAGPTATPEPVIAEPTLAPIVVEPPPGQRADVKGTILFSRGGDIWAASGQELRRLSNSDSIKSDSGPTWSPDGKHIFFVRTTKRPTKNSRPGGLYTLYPTDVYRMKADGSDKKKVYDSLLKDSRGTWFSHVLQPDVGPDGTTLAVVSDGPDGSGPVVLHVLNSRSGRLRKVAAPIEGDLGHNDPAFSPDGRKIAFSYIEAKGTNGVPRIAIHSCQTRANCSLGKTRLLRPGFAHPSWAPDSSWLAVEATRGEGRDIAIINPGRGDVRVLLTDDGNSFAPVVSPDGDQIAYLHRDSINVDVRVMTLDIDGSKITLVDDRAVTSDGAIDGESPPSWFIPKDQLTSRQPTVDESADSLLAADESGQPDASDEPDDVLEPAPGGASEGVEADASPVPDASGVLGEAPPPPAGS